MVYIGYVAAFSYSFLLIILSIMGKEMQVGQTYRLYTTIVASICFLALFKEIIFNKVKLTKKSLAIFFSLPFFAIGMILTYANYGYLNPTFITFSFALGGRVIPAIVMAIILANRKNSISKLCQVVPLFIMLYTLGTLLTLLNPTGITTGGYLSDSSGLNYQDISYYSIFALAFNLFYIFFYNLIPKESLWTKFGKRYLFVLLVPVQIIVVLLSGGRGAVVLLFVISLYFLVNFLKKNQKNKKKGIKLIIFIIPLFLMYIYFILSKLQIRYNGFNRISEFITALFNGNSIDEIRILKYLTAEKLFAIKPLFGHGIGSIFYEAGTYSHNLFADIAVEFGIIGLIALFVILLLFLRKMFILIKRSSEYHLISMFFLCGLVMLMFSGYYLGEPLSWFAVTYSLVINKNGLGENK